MVLIVAIRTILQEEEEGFKMAPSNFVPTINEGSEKYASKSCVSSLCDRPSDYVYILCLLNNNIIAWVILLVCMSLVTKMISLHLGFRYTGYTSGWY